MIRAQANQIIGAQMTDATTGAAFAGTVTVYLTIDTQAQIVGAVGAGVCTAKGNGYYDYQPTQAETDGALIAFTFVGSGAVGVTIQVATVTQAQQVALQSAGSGVAIAVSTLIAHALQTIGALAAGETPDANVMADAFIRLNRMIDLWAVQRQTINGVQRVTLPVSVNHSPYTVGSGGDFNLVRPVTAPMVTIALATNPAVDLPVAIIDAVTYAAIPAKTIKAQVASQAYYDFAGPTLANLYFWPILNDASVTISLWTPVALAQFISPSQTLVLLPGYQSAIELNLAVVLAPEFGRPVDPEVKQQAQAAFGWIKRANVTIPGLRSDPALLRGQAGGANWFTGP